MEHISQTVMDLRQKTFNSDVELKIAKMEQQAAEDSIKDTLIICSPEKRRILENKIYATEQELEELKWKVTGTEIEKIELLNAKDQANREAIQYRQQFQQSRSQLESVR